MTRWTVPAPLARRIVAGAAASSQGQGCPEALRLRFEHEPVRHPGRRRTAVRLVHAIVHALLALSSGGCQTKHDANPSGSMGASSSALDTRGSAAETPHFVGAERCARCHDAAYVFWNNTPHARAYWTLTSQHQEQNAACIGCHVTGFEQPGGSRLNAVAGLDAVQCENCHGPGSRHIQSGARAFIRVEPSREECRACHHEPHVARGWDVEAAWKKIVGPGHEVRRPR
jgi:hypothetical protein